MRKRLIREIDISTGLIVLEAYRLDGKLHRDPHEGPAFVTRSVEDGEIHQQRYYWNGRLHRVDGPASIEIGADNVTLVGEMYYRHGVLHRDPKQGPAWIERTGYGIVLKEVYYFNGGPYRDPSEGPYCIDRDVDGSIESEEYSQPGASRPTRRSRVRSGPPPEA